MNIKQLLFVGAAGVAGLITLTSAASKYKSLAEQTAAIDKMVAEKDRKSVV